MRREGSDGRRISVASVVAAWAVRERRTWVCEPRREPQRVGPRHPDGHQASMSGSLSLSAATDSDLGFDGSRCSACSKSPTAPPLQTALGSRPPHRNAARDRDRCPGPAPCPTSRRFASTAPFPRTARSVAGRVSPAATGRSTPSACWITLRALCVLRCWIRGGRIDGESMGDRAPHLLRLRSDHD